MKRRFFSFLCAAGLSFMGLSAQNFIVGDNATILSSSTGGSSWESKTVDGVSGNILGLGVVDADTVYIGGTQGYVLKSTDGLETVVVNDTLNKRADDRINQFIIGDDGKHVSWTGRYQYHDGHFNTSGWSNDHGQTWDNYPDGNGTVRGRHSVATARLGGNVFFGGDNLIIRANYPGYAGFAQVYDVNAPKSFNDILEHDGKIFVVGNWGRAFVSADDGVTWTAIPGITTTRDLQVIAVSPSGNRMIIAGNDSYRAYSADGGDTWAAAGDISNGRHIVSAQYANEDTLYLGASLSNTDRWSIYFSEDGGATSIYNNSGYMARQHNTLRSMHWFDGQTGILGFSANDPGLVLFTENGLNAPYDTLLTGVRLWDIHAFNRDTMLFAFRDGDVRMTEDAGNNWSVVIAAGAAPFPSINFVDDTLGYISASNGRVWKTVDGGFNWTNVLVDAEASHFAMHDGWLCGDGYRIYKTADYETFERKYAFPDETFTGARGMFGIDGVLYVVGYNGMIMETDNNGATWKGITTADDLTTDMNDVVMIDVNTGWAIGNDGLILSTADGFENFTIQATPTTENLNAIYAYDADTLIVVGDKGTILTTSNGGTSWYLLESGTTANLRDVVLRDISGALVIPTLSVANPASAEYCPGTVLDAINYTVSEGEFADGNEFILQLSDASGSFASPSVLAQQAGTTSGSFVGVDLPEVLTASAAYKVRVVTTLPAISAAADTTLEVFPEVNKAATPSVGVGEETTLCEGDNSNTLSTAGANNADSYAWTIFPAEAGAITGSGTDVVLDWSVAFAGEAKVVVAGINTCGTGETSDTLVFTVDSQPTAGFTYVIDATEVTFTNTSIGAASYAWNFDDGSPASVEESPIHTYTANGEYTVILDVVNGACSDEHQETFNITAVSVASIAAESLTIYPNPTSGQINVRLAGPSVITVVGVNGAVIEVLNVQAAGNVVLDLPGAGNYLINVNDNSYKVVVE